MKQKTSMQELIDDLKQMQEDMDYPPELNMAIEHAESMLEKEKAELKNAYQLILEKDFKEVSSTPEIESKLTQLREDMGNVGIPYKAGKYIIALEDEINRLRIEIAELKSTIKEYQRNNK